MIWKLLRRNISIWQIAGYAFSTLVGLIIVLVALQFYRDVSGGLQADSSEDGGFGLISKRNIVISKPVGLKSSISGKAPAFSKSDIADLSRQKWSGAVMPFQAADFKVWAGLDLGGRSLSTALFFESVPDSIIDISPDEWSFNPAQPLIPIIISKDYLTLYNFGFAASGNMPMLSEGMIGSVPLTVTIAGRGRTATLPARIVGFSSWLNTVAVPQAFMDWAHDSFGEEQLAEPSRLVVELADPSDPAIDEYLSAHGYEVAGPDNDLGRVSFFLTLLTSVIASIGALITLLALGILILSLYLLVQKNRKAISGLLLLGYTPREVSARYLGLVMSVNVSVLLLACVALPFIRGLWVSGLEALSIRPASLWFSLGIGALIMIVISTLNALTIRRLVTRCFR